MIAADFLLFFAAGNAGSNAGTVFSPSTAKNAVSVGATLRAASAESMATFSGCGPAADGRIKPDVTIPGSAIVSARSDGSGTPASRSAPRIMSPEAPLGQSK